MEYRELTGKLAGIVGLGLALWVSFRFLLPALLPFFLGAGLALAAEPAVAFGEKKLRLSRSWAAGAGVTLTLALAAGGAWLLGALAVRELGTLTRALPDARQTVNQGIGLLREGLTGVAQGLPGGVRPLATSAVEALFEGDEPLLRRAAERATQAAGALLRRLPAGALGVGTGLLSGFMISARLPQLRQWVTARLPKSWKEKTLPALARIRRGLWQWVKAQARLAAVTAGILAAGFLLLGVRYAPVWALLIALVDAVPVLGTGTVLIPWSLVCFLKGQTLRGAGLLGLYALALVVRTVLEPRVLGRHLGLDPLVTLVFLYAGYRLWGIPGMLLAPMAATAVKSVTTQM